jgi:hypothetical protein
LGRRKTHTTDNQLDGVGDDCVMSEMRCTRATGLSIAEKRVFADHLAHQGLAENVWDLFGEWIERSTAEVAFFYLKVHSGDDLLGLGMFVQIQPFDLRASYAALRKTGALNMIGKIVSRLSSNSVVVSFRNLITSNHTRPFFFRTPEVEDAAMGAMLAHLKADRTADMVTVVDTANHATLYHRAGFSEYASSSESWFDVTRYQDLSEYLATHKSLRRNLKRRRSRITVEVRNDVLSEMELRQVKACVGCSVQHSLVANPCQRFFEENIFATQVYRSKRYTHILVRVDGTIAGFHTFQISGSSMGGVLGGFNREMSRNNFVYERVIVASMDHAIGHGLRRIRYSLVDNHTKLRLVDLREPCRLYFYSGSAMNRAVFKHTFKYNDVHALWQLENPGT